MKPGPDIRHITAAGGVIVRRSKSGSEVLAIFRRGVWDLPKGKLDRGESIRECALREVREELGIADSAELLIVADLSTTVHTFLSRKRHVVKTTHWFLMTTSARSFIPQAEEDIHDVKWMSIKKAIRKIDFETLRDLLRRERSVISSHR